MNAVSTVHALVATGVQYRVRERVLGHSPKQLGAFLCDRLPKISMTCVKLGQLVSSRPDLFDKELCRSLVTLQDGVAPMAFDTVRAVLDDSKVAKALKSVDPNPVASATIAQVHRGRLRDGSRVALKVLRPGVLQQLTRDMDLMDGLLQAMTAASLEGAADTKALLLQFRETLLRETDFARERAALTRFRRLFSRNPMVLVPAVYSDLSCDNVLVMEFVPSVRLCDVVDQTHRSSLAVLLMGTFLSQILDGGLVHADPHGGNMGVAGTQQLVLYDFGNIIELPPGMQQSLKRVMLMMIEGDLDGIIAELPSLNVIVNEPQELRGYLQTYISYLRSLDIEEFKAATSTMPTEKVSKVPIKVGIEMLGLLRVMSMLEGTCKSLDESFQYQNVWPVLLLQLMADSDLIKARCRQDMKRIGLDFFEL